MTLLAKFLPTISQEIEAKISCSLTRKSGVATFSTVPAARRERRAAETQMVMLAVSQIWLRPWATVKENSTRHTVGFSVSADTVTCS